MLLAKVVIESFIVASKFSLKLSRLNPIEFWLNPTIGNCTSIGGFPLGLNSYPFEEPCFLKASKGLEEEITFDACWAAKAFLSLSLMYPAWAASSALIVFDLIAEGIWEAENLLPPIL